MPTYKNETINEVKVRLETTEWYSIAPGETKAIDGYTNNPNLTFISDAPYWNRIAQRDVVTLSGTASEVSIDSTTDYVLVTQITEKVSVFRQAEANTPAELEDWTGSDPIIQIPVDGRFTKLQLIGSGVCTVIQYA